MRGKRGGEEGGVRERERERERDREREGTARLEWGPQWAGEIMS